MPLSQDPVRIRLREALEHSTAGKFLRGARTRWADAWSHGRVPNKAEIRGLEARGNQCDDWNTVRLIGAGTLAGIRDCRFEGHNVLRLGDKAALGPRLRDSLIRDCMLNGCTVESVALLERVMVDHGAVLRHVGACSGCPDSCFSLGLVIQPGAETGTRRVFLADGLLLEDCAAMAALPPAEQEALGHEWTSRLKPCITDYAFVGAGARIEYTRFVENSYIGAGAVIRGASAVRRCVIASGASAASALRPDQKPGSGPAEDAVVIGDDVIAEDCVFEAGVRLHAGAQVRLSLFLEYSGAEQGGHVAASVIGPGTVVAKGEVTASLVGPFVGFHHQALLIGALWPEGRGNIGYGANVGSNHTGRKPDQELRPGEGTFFGLSCAIKYPADFSAAPYSLFATGVVTPPQRIALPLSLIAPDGVNPGLPETAGLNEIIPGWMWGENAYALIRNAYKYAERNKAQRHPVPALAAPEGSPLAGTFLAADLFAPRVSRPVAEAMALLNALPSLSSGTIRVITGKDLPAVGRNFLQTRRLATARAAYRNYLAFVFFRSVLWEPESSVSPSPESLKLAEQAGVDARDTAATLRIFAGLGVAVEASLRRDTVRGTQVFADYANFHPEAAKDAVYARLLEELGRLGPILQARLRQFT